jgi:PAS domain-containing protein
MGAAHGQARAGHGRITGVLHQPVRDITASRAAAEAQARLAAVVADSYDAIITTALDGTVLTWNAAAERL